MNLVISSECSKRNRDEEEAWHFNGMNLDYYENEGYDDVYDEDYDYEVFATLNKKAMRLMAQLIKFYKFYYLLYLNKRWLNSQ